MYAIDLKTMYYNTVYLKLAGVVFHQHDKLSLVLFLNLPRCQIQWSHVTAVDKYVNYLSCVVPKTGQYVM